ncbi:alpha/beta fold hydrolase [Streptomyces sp. CB02414]|uniref:alpha/beta fold hydrolase n=1 Tax=Streptomyces sp. CB02414 TaxID=1703922 RepID=UPI00093DD34A|nr:alpha/beta hydrolase [Streptomyces sp. CB02414]OKI81355.1 multidrug transporter [Streptomyces sp. CB02414]
MSTEPPPVVLLHALPFDASMWREQTAALTARGHRVLAHDQRGFGGTNLGDEPPSLDLVADDVARAMDERGMDRVLLAGCSMGGYVALALLRRHPDRVRALALLNTRGTADSDETAAGRKAFAERIMDGAVRGEVVAATTPLLLGATTRAERPDILNRVMAAAQAAPPSAVAWAQRAIAARPDALDVLRATGVPAVVVAGEEDTLVPLDEAAELERALPRGRLVPVPRAGHLLPLERPDVVTEILVGLVEDRTTDERRTAW